MNRLWRRRVPMEQFVIGWLLILMGVFSFCLGVVTLAEAF